jgi:uncharacterized protein (DUF302 family)
VRVISRVSNHDHAHTVGRLVAALEARGITLFARIDHAGAARDAGLELPEELMIVFGNPRAGTPLMQRDPRVGIELPLRILVWERDGAVHIGYLDPRELAAAYDLRDDAATLEQMAGLCEQLAAEAALSS